MRCIFVLVFVFLKSSTLLAATDFTKGTKNYELAKQGVSPKTTSTVKKATTPPKTTSTVKKAATPPKKISTVKKAATPPKKISTVKKAATPPKKISKVKKLAPYEDVNEIIDITEIVSVTGQGVVPDIAQSPAQGIALAKRAAIADAYRLLAEKIKGVKINGGDVIKNLMLKKSVVRTMVDDIINNATIVETTFKDGLYEVEMEIRFNHKAFR